MATNPFRLGVIQEAPSLRLGSVWTDLVERARAGGAGTAEAAARAAEAARAAGADPAAAAAKAIAAVTAASDAEKGKTPVRPAAGASKTPWIIGGLAVLVGVAWLASR